LLEHYDLPEMPGWESRLYLVEYGPGAAAPSHHHPVRGLGYVLSGSFESAFGNEPPALVHAGQAFVERENQPHTLFRNPDPVTPLRFVISFVVRIGAPVLETP
jgi:quercetin dioxygenase-like cupin family protein